MQHVDSDSFVHVPYSDRAGGIYWCLIRLLCHLITNILTPDHENDTEIDINLLSEAFENLFSIIIHCEKLDFAFIKISITPNRLQVA